MTDNPKNLTITSPSFTNGGEIPKKHTGFGEDVSPELHIEEIDDDVKSLAVIMDDLDIPAIGAYNHWVIWNIPKCKVIPESVEKCAVVEALGGAVQGIGYGKNKYRGPKQPFFIRKRHSYRFTVYALDSFTELPQTAGKAELLKAIDGHILASGTLTGTYKRT